MNWPTVKIGSLTSLVSSGSTPKGGSKVYLDEGPVMLIRSQNVRMRGLFLDDVAYITDEVASGMNRAVVQRGDVLLNITGASIGRVSLFDLNGVRANVNQHVCIVRPRADRLYAPYLMQYLAQPRFQARIDNTQRGGTRQALTFSQIKDFEIPLPPLAEQKRIAAILDKADAIRRKRQEAIALTEELLRSLFLEMFGDPVTNPKGWPVVTLEAAVNLVNGRAFKPSDWSEDGLPIVRIQNLRRPSANFNHYNGKFHEKHRVIPGDLLMSWSGQLVSFGVFIWRGPEGVLNQHIFNVHPKLEFTLDYLQQALSLVVDRAKSQFNGIDMKHLTKRTLHRQVVLQPPIGAQRRFSEVAARHLALMNRNLKGKHQTDALFHSLVQRAFKGEL
jgi:type I restriction enzyme S subunit